jgi:hypothetical protein
MVYNRARRLSASLLSPANSSTQPVNKAHQKLKLRLRDLFRRFRGQLPVTRRRFAALRAELDARVVELQQQNAQLANTLNIRANTLDGRTRDLHSRADSLSDYLLALPGLAGSAPSLLRKAMNLDQAIEVCLFVTHSTEARLKPHVRDHVASLAAEGIDVVLIVNTTLPFEDFSLDEGMVALLAGCLIRANLGFDFAAWAHAYSLQQRLPRWQRIYLVNDSIVGPLGQDSFAAMIATIRSMRADFIGLTGNPLPQPHLQSYFMVINQRLLHSAVFDHLMRGIVNLPTKEDVIAQYETQLTRYLSAQGFECGPVFPAISTDPSHTNDTVCNWAPLIELGFPFIKTSVLAEFGTSPDGRRLVPAKYLPTGAQ